MAFKIFWRVVLSLLILLLFLLSIAILNASLMKDTDIVEFCDASDEDYVSELRGFLKRFAESISFKTISFDYGQYDKKALKNFIHYIKENFPLIHSSPLITKEVINNFSLLYYIKGQNQNLKPYLLAGHLDVVPVDESQWKVPPFSGHIRDNAIWGRGTIDSKHIIMGVMESLEFLLEKNFQPQRSFYLAFGHDEEIGGYEGAQYISKLLQSRNVELEYILDEGSPIVDDIIPGIKNPVAFVSITEKGHLSLELSVNTSAGHSSLPSKENAIQILAKALSKLESDTFPSMFGKGGENEMMQNMALCASFPLKVVLGNVWLFKPLLLWKMSAPFMNAIHRTTIAITIISGGTKSNVLPSYATAIINLRIHPAQTIQEAFSFIKEIINDERVKTKILYQSAPHPLSPIDSFGYNTIKTSIKQIYKESCIVPVTLIANTDTRWYLNLTSSIYRFNMIRMKPKDFNLFHGHNERMSLDNYINLVNFFVHIIKNSDKSLILNHDHYNEL